MSSGGNSFNYFSENQLTKLARLVLLNVCLCFVCGIADGLGLLPLLPPPFPPLPMPLGERKFGSSEGPRNILYLLLLLYHLRKSFLNHIWPQNPKKGGGTAGLHSPHWIHCTYIQRKDNVGSTFKMR